MLAFVLNSGEIRRSFGDDCTAGPDGTVLRGDIAYTCPPVCQRVDISPLAASEVPQFPRMADLVTMAELPDVAETAALADRLAADPLRRDKVSPASVAELVAKIGAVADPDTRAALDKLARIVAKGYPGA